MTHLDEGTVHAWLDGALDAAQSAEIDAHVKSCAECAAKVAEARGLIAASSRILTALDDVPANVVPKRAVPPVRRRRSIMPWVSGLAAAVVLITLWRTGDVQQPSSRQILVSQPKLDSAIPAVTSVETSARPTIAPLPTPAAPPAARRPQAVERRREAAQAQVGNLAGPVAGAAAGAAAGAGVASADARAAEEDRLAGVVGCYELAEQKLAMQEVVATSASTEVRAPERLARARAAAPAPAAAVAPADQMKKADAAVTLTSFRLDDRGLVRKIGTDSIIGSWDQLGRDSIRTIIANRSRIVTSGNRVRCP